MKEGGGVGRVADGCGERLFVGIEDDIERFAFGRSRKKKRI